MSSQRTVTGVDYMAFMIPHHSIAILISDCSQIIDPRRQELADEKMLAQRREIKEMQWVIADVRENGYPLTEAKAAEHPLTDFEAFLI